MFTTLALLTIPGNVSTVKWKKNENHSFIRKSFPLSGSIKVNYQLGASLLSRTSKSTQKRKGLLRNKSVIKKKNSMCERGTEYVKLMMSKSN